MSEHTPESTQWFNPPYTSTGPKIVNSFGVQIASFIDADTAAGVAKALNCLHRLGYDETRDAIGVASK